jgi:predicted 2-oxoglutarate/Fe(II)-dependent dioxygenase YbiX
MFNIVQEIKDYGLYLSNCISQEDIDEILELSKSDLLESGTTRLGPYTSVHYSENSDTEALQINNKIFQKIYPVMVKSMDVYTSHFGLDVNKYTMSEPVFWIKRWDIGANIGHHSDSWESNGEEQVPAVSVVLYLSSDFEGGELVFVDEFGKYQKDKDISITPLSGHVAIFNSQVVHGVKPVLSGNRISTDITYMK